MILAPLLPRNPTAADVYVDARRYVPLSVGPVVRFEIFLHFTRANNLLDHEKLIGALFNWLLLGVLTMQTCGYNAADWPSLHPPDLAVTADVYYLCFPKDYQWITFSGALLLGCSIFDSYIELSTAY